MDRIPEYTGVVLEELEKNGFEAYLVGGCVRDFIMNITPHDFDITTNALPQQIKEVFSGYRTIPTGEKHGTITVMSGGNAVEVTTYRIDSGYTDGRHPDSVEFSSSLAEDLKRRDFTINAMAMDINGEITDLFGGRQDIADGIIRTVGNPQERFTEDALRILRALRFASRFGFTLDRNTADTALMLRETLGKISAERIQTEFRGIINGGNAERILRNYREIIAEFIPEIVPCFGFSQHNPFHKYDVWEHIIHAVQAANSPDIRLAMFFHDISKPQCFTLDSEGVGHFKGHAEKSAETAEVIMKRLRFSCREIKKIKTLIFYHREKFADRYALKRVIGELGAENIFDLFDVQRADLMAKNDFCREELKKISALENDTREIIAKNECVSVKSLKINGNDLQNIGIYGADIKKVSEALLEKVMKELVENDREALISCAKLITETL